MCKEKRLEINNVLIPIRDKISKETRNYIASRTGYVLLKNRRPVGHIVHKKFIKDKKTNFWFLCVDVFIYKSHFDGLPDISIERIIANDELVGIKQFHINQGNKHDNP